MQPDITAANGSNKIVGVPAPPPMPTTMTDLPSLTPPPATPAPMSVDPVSAEPTQEVKELPSMDSPTAAPVDDQQALNTLAEIKQDALNELQPLVGHLNQAPEESFKTTMMMVQSTDNHNLLKEALKYAKSIPDEQKRAQALLDVVNETNYFTQHVFGSKK